MQVEQEFAAWCDILKNEGVRSYIEVGSNFGGSLHRAALCLPLGSLVVSVDLPCAIQSEQALKATVQSLSKLDYEVHLFMGDSTSTTIIEAVRKLGPFDACFIDANHTRKYIEQDFANYGSMSKIVAFHDIAFRREPGWKGRRIDVPEVWEAIKGDYRHVEFKYHPGGNTAGIGVLWK